jgi:hypothetical protein
MLRGVIDGMRAEVRGWPDLVVCWLWLSYVLVAAGLLGLAVALVRLDAPAVPAALAATGALVAAGALVVAHAELRGRFAGA